MKCPKCGGQARYVVSRKKLWKGESGYSATKTKPREDFKAKCIKCGHEFDASKIYNVADIVIAEPEVKKWKPKGEDV